MVWVVAPIVVDATAVEFVDALELDLSVLAFDPMESDEEDDTGVSIVPVVESGIAWLPSFSVGVQHCGCFQGLTLCSESANLSQTPWRFSGGSRVL